MSNPQRTYTDDGTYFDYIDNVKNRIIDETDAMIVKSHQGQATLSVTTTWAVAYADIAATDIVFTQVTSQASAAYILTSVVSAGVGFTVVFNTAPGVGTFDWMVVRQVPSTAI